MVFTVEERAVVWKWNYVTLAAVQNQ